MLWDPAKQRNVGLWGQKSENEPSPQGLFCALYVNTVFILYCPKNIYVSNFCTIIYHGIYQRWKLLVWGEAEQEARELKHLGLCKSTDTQCWCFELCLHFTPTSYLGSEA